MNIEEFRNVRVSTGVDDEYAALVGAAQPGLILEFGVFRGGSINRIANLCPDRTVWGFDSFTGTPDTWHKGGNRRTPMSNFDMCGALPMVEPNVRLVQGMFQDVLPAWWEEHRAPIGILNIDSDLYESAIFVLRTLNDGIVRGTLIRFDELCDFRHLFKIEHKPKRGYCNWQEGEWRALNEWIEECGRKVIPVGRGPQCGVVRVEV